uniref:RNase H type-1 domain-containing protein n=1 Tax=Cannabis sativa TaxID=3483 RepID=A0A803PBT8_CANSA
METVTHALIDCNTACTVWKHSKFKDFFTTNRGQDIQDYYLQGLATLTKDELLLLISILWHIWNTQNTTLFKKSYSIENVEEFVMNYLEEYQEAQRINGADTPSADTSQQPSNSKPSSLHIISNDSISLFVDAALEHTNCVTGLGFVIKRGSNQVLASASIQKPSAPTSIFAEGQALLEGLSWCLSLQMQPNFIITDCLNLVTKVNGQWQDNSALSSLVSKIRQSFSNFPATSLHHLS